MSDDLQSDLDQSIRFLEWLRPGGPWVLTAIPAEGGRTTTVTLSDPGDTRAWLAERSGKLNLYFAVNPLRANTDKKAKKEDVAELAFLHVDVDPRKGEDLAQEQRRALKVLQDFRPAPSAIIFSGGGYQGFWRLDEPLYLGGAEAQIAEAEAYNRQLEIVLGGDHCWNVDRIMRIPGTINVPDAKKRGRGRTETMATIVNLTDAAYPLHDFTPAPEVQSAKGATSSARVKISGNLPRLKDMDELPEAVTQRTRMLIVQGDDPDDPTRYGSKSEVMWAVVCELVRAGCDDDTIAAVLLDPDLGISDHPLRQKRSVEYVARQIERARDEVAMAEIDPKGRRVLDPAAPFATATRLHAEIFPTAIHWNGDFLEYHLGAYRAAEDASIRSALWKALEGACIRRTKKDGVEFAPFKPGTAHVNAVLDALRGVVHQPADRMAPPVWLNGDGPLPGEIVSCRNGLLHVPTSQLLPTTPRFFTRNALEIDFDVDAAAPVEWLRFVEQVFPDPLAAALLQEWLGYLLLPDVSQQKILLLVGPPRSGKGVIQHVITALVGPKSVCAPSTNSLGGNSVGALQPLIGATVAFLTDARFGGRAEKVAITANLLAISSGDRMTIDRKYRDPWEGCLNARLVVMSNELPGLRDNSPALANRFTPLMLEQSFLGREDHGLASRIIGNELPGVLVWALEGWRRLRARGRFLLPVASEEAIAEILDLGSPVAAFVNSRCDLGDGRSVEKEQLYRAYKVWCEGTGQHAVAPNVFSRDLSTATGGKVRPSKTRVGAQDGARVPVFIGIGLRDDPDVASSDGDGRWELLPY